MALPVLNFPANYDFISGQQKILWILSFYFLRLSGMFSVPDPAYNFYIIPDRDRIIKNLVTIHRIIMAIFGIENMNSGYP